jgi:protein-tyrosine phosphatase
MIEVEKYKRCATQLMATKAYLNDLVTFLKECEVVDFCERCEAFSLPEDGRQCNYYFRAHNTDPAIWGHAVQLVVDLIEEGKDILLHCVHGRDRTGGVGYAVIRTLYPSWTHGTVCNVMKNHMRPAMEEEWSTILDERQEFYNEILQELNNDYLN